MPLGADAGRTWGTLLVAGSTVFFALAGILTKSIAADPLAIACWRGLFGGLVVALYVFAWRRFATGSASLRLGWRGWVLALVGAVSSIAFIAAFKLTYVANVTVIYATIPFIAAGLEWLWFGTRLRRRTMIVSAVSLAGVAIVASGGLGGGHWLGDLVALAMTAGSAAYIVMIRAFRDVPVVWAGAVSAFMLFAAGWVLTSPADISTHDLALCALFGLTFALAVITWTEGARLIPATEVGLIGSAEVPAAILLAWVILGEWPPVASIAGAMVVMAALIAHSVRDLAAADRGVAKDKA